MNRYLLPLCAVLLLGACSSVPPASDPALLKEQVTAAEVAFAKTMADRDLAAFSRLLSDEAVFVNAGKAVHGKQAISAEWKAFYESPRAPFSWKPDMVEVLSSGVLAYSTGPVTNADGVLVARFNSIWRLEAPGQWRVVFDSGAPVCNCPKP